jgi:hypothetical protein
LNPNEKRFHHYVFVDRKRGKTERERQKLDSIKLVASTQFILDSQGDGRRLLYHIRERAEERYSQTLFLSVQILITNESKNIILKEQWW